MVEDEVAHGIETEPVHEVLGVRGPALVSVGLNAPVEPFNVPQDLGLM